MTLASIVAPGAAMSGRADTPSPASFEAQVGHVANCELDAGTRNVSPAWPERRDKISGGPLQNTCGPARDNYGKANFDGVGHGCSISNISDADGIAYLRGIARHLHLEVPALDTVTALREAFAAAERAALCTCTCTRGERA